MPRPLQPPVVLSVKWAVSSTLSFIRLLEDQWGMPESRQRALSACPLL